MTGPVPSYRLHCGDCQHETVCGLADMLQRLREHGTLRRQAQPDWATVLELFRHRLPSLACSACGRRSLELRVADDDFAGWPGSTLCRSCGRVIPPERLEIFPDETQCAACRASDAVPEREFCPRCGGVLQITHRPRSGLTRYQDYCPSCGYHA